MVRIYLILVKRYVKAMHRYYKIEPYFKRLESVKEISGSTKVLFVRFIIGLIDTIAMGLQVS